MVKLIVIVQSHGSGSTKNEEGSKRTFQGTKDFETMFRIIKLRVKLDIYEILDNVAH